MSDLPEDLRALSAAAPNVADWPGLVRAEVRTRQRRRTAASTALAVVLVGVAGVGLVYAVDEPTQRLATTDPSPKPSPLASPVQIPPDPSTAPPLPTAPPVRSAAPTAAASPTAAEVSPPSAAPSPEETFPTARNVITLEITLSPEQPVVGEPVTITVVARGDKDTPRLTQFTYDRGRQRQTYPIAGCVPEPREPVAPKPGSSSDTVTVTYTESGPETIRVEANSGCSYYPGENSATRDVAVVPAPQSSPSPAP